MTIILSNLNRVQSFFSLEDSLVNLSLNGNKIPPKLAYVAGRRWKGLEIGRGKGKDVKG